MSKVEDRFWQHVRKEEGEDACWIWTASTCGGGYSKTTYKGMTITAHRMALMLSGAIGPHQVARHVCPRNNKLCVRHVVAGTQSQNRIDASVLGTSCKHSKEVVQAIRDEYAKGQSTQQELAEKYNVSKRHVNRLVNFKQRNF